MTDDQPAPPAESTPVEPPRIILTFAGPGLAACTVTAPGVELAQLMAGAFYLDALARNAVEGSFRQLAAATVAPPTIADLAALRASGRL